MASAICFTAPLSLVLQASSTSCSPRLPTTALAATAKKRRNYRPTILNRPARFRYDISETHECGVELLGTEIKSIREGSMNLKDGYARVTDGQIFLHNVHISGWLGAHKAFNHDPLRVRRLLLHKRLIRKLAAKQTDVGLTIIPLRAYFSDNNYLKVEIGLARGKKLHDKREDLKKRDNERDMRRDLKDILNR